MRTNPVTGETLVVRDTGADLLRVEITAHPGRPGPPAHVHPGAAERFVVRSGALRVRVGRERRVLRAGEEATAAPGETHAYTAVGDEPAVFTVELVPPGGMAAFFDGVYGLAERGLVGRIGQPGLLRVAPLFDAHLSDIALPGVPLPVQRPVWRALASLGRLVHGS